MATPIGKGGLPIDTMPMHIIGRTSYPTFIEFLAMRPID